MPNKRNFFRVETILGLGLGLGYLTSLRFTSVIGVPEILILISIFFLFMKNNSVFFLFNRNFYNFIKIYFFFVLFVQLPVMTLTTSIITDYNSDPIYILSFIHAYKSNGHTNTNNDNDNNINYNTHNCHKKAS